MSPFPFRSCVQLLVSHNSIRFGVALRPPAVHFSTRAASPFHAAIPLRLAHVRQYSVESASESVKVGHATFLAEADKKDNWDTRVRDPKFGDEAELQGVKPGKGKLQPTTTHLFKLILPLAKTRPPTVFLIHPSQPLSHLARLIASALRKAPSNIYFCAAPDVVAEGEITKELEDTNYNVPELGGEVQWADSTDIGDFTKSAARSRYFHIVIEQEDPSSADAVKHKILEVAVPTFERRTVYLKRRLDWIKGQRQELDNIKAVCDTEARQATKRLAYGGLAAMVAYWLTIFRLTFWEYGWGVMEPVSYLAGISMIILGYSWFLYQGREVSYSSIMNSSISRRRSQLYESKGFDLDRWTDLVTEEKMIKKEISKIAQDYGLEWTGGVAKEVKREEKKKDKGERVEDDHDLEEDEDDDDDSSSLHEPEPKSEKK